MSKWARWPASGISASSAAHLGGESYLGSAILISRIRKPLHHQRHVPDRGPIWRDIPVGLRHVWRTPFLRITLLCAAGINIVFAGLSLAIIAAQTAHGSAAAHIGAAFGMGAIGGILGAWAAAPLQRRIAPAGLVYIFGWTATLGLATLSETHNAYAIGALLAAVFFTATPANAMLFAVQIHITPPQLQGRVIGAAMLTGGIAAPLGPLLAGYLFDHTGQAPTFLTFATVVAALTLAMHLSATIRTMRRPGG